MKNSMTDEQLANEIRRIIYDNSGGVKFVDLVMNVGFSMQVEDVDRIERVIKESTDLEILQYASCPEQYRIKQFVYLKLTGPRPVD